MSRTHRKPKTGPKAADPTCRNHGTCPACQNSRKRKEKEIEHMTTVEMMFRDVFPDVQFVEVKSHD